MKKAGSLGIVWLAALLPVPLAAQGLSVEGEIGLAARSYTQNGALPGQAGSGTEMIGAMRLAVSGGLGFGDFTAELKGRTNARTGATSLDLSKAHVSGDLDGVRWLVGRDVVFWGVTESYNPVNVINQRGDFASTGEEDRLGQTMAMLSFETAGLGNFSLYGLFGFRPFDEPRRSDRLRYYVAGDDRRTLYESGEGVDFALRNTNTVDLGNGSLDYAVSLFSGRDRQPVYLPGCAFKTATVSEATCDAVNADIRASYESLSGRGNAGLLAQIFGAASPATRAFLLGGDSVGAVPYYQDMQQVGLELAYATGDWLFKFEGAQRFTARDNYFAGVIGAEYAFGDVFGSGGGLTVTAEYLYDDRSALQPPTFVEDDVFLGVRYDFNNMSGASLSVGALRDLDSRAMVTTVEASWRLAGNTRVSVSSAIIDADDPFDPLSALDRDDFLEIGLDYFF
ncbi:hypothetical protein [Rhodovulum adriaticum]|uniref:Porin n=1 Tax=Rhodovulum adriaticum TaxID=35804 RepID=A0A4R2NIL6_RHOAD|nr:hypothetical protein [Rhodovulum adriaticum]MBK1635415.1 hypothetical protein [Rhodovulum adriaticum]TCP21122.1 hypothetical protein EV656_11343 [Rhodovulum adriaticum]